MTELLGNAEEGIHVSQNDASSPKDDALWPVLVIGLGVVLTVVWSGFLVWTVVAMATDGVLWAMS